MSNKSKQPHVTENPDVRDVEVSTEEVQGTGKVPVYDADPTRLDLSQDTPEVVSSATVDQVVGPDHPAAVIVPPEGRGTHPKLGLDAARPEDLFASGEATPATGVEDGKVVTADDQKSDS